MTGEIWIAKQNFYILLVLFLISYRKSGFCHSEIKELLGLKDAQMNRAIKLLSKNLWIIPRIIPVKKKNRILVKYELANKGKLFVKMFPSVIKKYPLKITK